jgi:hypothetical protein
MTPNDNTPPPPDAIPEGGYNYEEFRTEPGGDLLTQIAQKARDLVAAEAAVAKAEQALKDAQKIEWDIRSVDLPELMKRAEQEKLTTIDGIDVEVNENLRGSVPDANKPKAYKWLEDNGHGNIVKRQFIIDFNRDEQAKVEAFRAELEARPDPLRIDIKNGVHPQTMLAWCREQLAAGKEFPKDLFGIFPQNLAKVKVKKAKTAF